MDNRAKTSKSNLGAYVTSKWKLGKTTAIRVPDAIKDEVLEYARKLDSGNKDDNKSEIINEVVEKLVYSITPKSEGGGYDGRKSRELRDRVLEVIGMLEE